MFDMKKVGERISCLRKKDGMTQMSLANKLCISYQAVSNWERGIAMPDISNLKELAEIFKTSVDDILGDEKSADILLSSDSGTVPNVNLSAAEFNSLAPLLPPDKNMLMLDAVNECFNEDEAREAMTNIDCEADDFAKRAYENGNIAMFSMFLNDISDSLKAELCERAFLNENVSFLSLLIHRMPAKTQTEYAKRAFLDGNATLFQNLKKYLDENTTKKLRDIAFESGNVTMFSCLYKKKSKNKHADDDEAEIAEYAYESDDLPTFCEVVDHLNKDTLSRLFERAYKDSKIHFVSEMVDYVSKDDIKNGATAAYESGNLELFSEMICSMDKQTKKHFKMLSASDKRTDFLSEILADE